MAACDHPPAGVGAAGGTGGAPAGAPLEPHGLEGSRAGGATGGGDEGTEVGTAHSACVAREVPEGAGGGHRYERHLRLGPVACMG